MRALGLLTIQEIAERLGIAASAVKDWRDRGLLRGHRYNDKGQCLTRIMQDLQSATMRQLGPDQIAFLRSLSESARKQQSALVKGLHRCHDRSHPSKGLKEESQTFLDLFVWIQNWLAHRIIDEADRQRRFQFAPPSFVQNAAGGL
jgi:predicted site-specific integrase-resolvase